MAVNKNHIPNFANTVQNSFALKQRKDENKQAQVQASHSNSQKQYADGKKLITEGLDRVQKLKETTPEGQLPDLVESEKMFLQASSVMDTLGAKLGYAPVIQDHAMSVFRGPSGTTLAQNRGLLSAQEDNSAALGAQALGTPALEAQGEVTAESARLAAEAKAGLPARRGAAAGNEEANKREALGTMLIELAKVDPGSAEGKAIMNEARGTDDKQFSGTALQIALGRAGALDSAISGVALTDEQMAIVESEYKRLRGTEPIDVAAQLIGAVLGSPVGSASGGGLSAQEQARLAELEGK